MANSAHRKDRSEVATHIVLLTRIFDLSEGDVLEIGTGWFSTTLLHWLGTVFRRQVYSYETRDLWYNRVKKHESQYHHIILLNSWDELDLGDRYFGMVFIDHGPDRRRIVEVKKLANQCDYMVIHDTEPARNGQYNYEDIKSLFKYWYDYKKTIPWTSVASNIKKLDKVK